MRGVCLLSSAAPKAGSVIIILIKQNGGPRSLVNLAFYFLISFKKWASAVLRTIFWIRRMMKGIRCLCGAKNTRELFDCFLRKSQAFCACAIGRFDFFSLPPSRSCFSKSFSKKVHELFEKSKVKSDSARYGGLFFDFRMATPIVATGSEILSAIKFLDRVLTMRKSAVNLKWDEKQD